MKLYTLALLALAMLFLFGGSEPVAAFDSHLPTPTVAPEPTVPGPADDITSGLDAIPAHLGILPLVMLIVELLKRGKVIKGGQATWVARGLGGALYVLYIALPADVLADVVKILAGVAEAGWAIYGSQWVYDIGQSFRVKDAG